MLIFFTGFFLVAVPAFYTGLLGMTRTCSTRAPSARGMSTFFPGTKMGKCDHFPIFTCNVSSGSVSKLAHLIKNLSISKINQMCHLLFSSCAILCRMNPTAFNDHRDSAAPVWYLPPLNWASPEFLLHTNRATREHTIPFM